jgi:hypothetical protein
LVLSLSFSSELFLAMLYHFAWLYHFSCLLLVFVVFLLLDDLLKLFLASGLLDVLHGVSDSRFKLCAFVVSGLIKGRLRNQVVSSLV